MILFDILKNLSSKVQKIESKQNNFTVIDFSEVYPAETNITNMLSIIHTNSFARFFISNINASTLTNLIGTLYQNCPDLPGEEEFFVFDFSCVVTNGEGKLENKKATITVDPNNNYETTIDVSGKCSGYITYGHIALE